MRGIPNAPGAEQALKRAHVLAWVTLAYLASTIAMLFFVMSGSQALKTEMSGELLSIVPPVLFLIGDRIGRRPPNRLYPFGHERAVSAGYVGASVALLMVGIYLLFDGGMKLVMREHPTIGGFPIFGHVIWTGWLGIAVLVWSGGPAFFIGRAKRKCAEILHDKTLAADAAINAADWQSASAAIIGMIGLAYGLWWADSLAAVLISLEIIRSGWRDLRTALGDVMDRRPKTIDTKEEDPLPGRIREFLAREPWVDDVIVRVRERGREMTAEAHVVPTSSELSVDALSKASVEACRIDPRLTGVTIAPVSRMPDDVARARDPDPASA